MSAKVFHSNTGVVYKCNHPLSQNKEAPPYHIYMNCEEKRSISEVPAHLADGTECKRILRLLQNKKWETKNGWKRKTWINNGKFPTLSRFPFISWFSISSFISHLIVLSEDEMKNDCEFSSFVCSFVRPLDVHPYKFPSIAQPNNPSINRFDSFIYPYMCPNVCTIRSGIVLVTN